MSLGIIKSVERCSITVSNLQNTVDYTLTKGQDASNCVPFATWKATTASNSTPDNWFFDVEMLSGPARVRVQRNSSLEQYLVIVYVIEFEPTKIKVQQGTWSIGNGSFLDTVALGDSVVKANSVIQFYYRYNSSSTVARDMMFAGYIKTGGADVEFQRYQSATSVCTGHYYVFEALNSEFSVTNYDTGNTTAQFVEITIPAVTTSRTFITTSYTTNNTQTAIEESTFYARLKDTVTVRVDRNQNSGDTSRHWVQVIEAPDDSIFVQHRYIYLDAATAYDDWTLPQPVDFNRAISHSPTMFPGARTDGSPWYRGMFRHYITTDGTRNRIERYEANSTTYVTGQVIEFTGSAFFCEGTVRVNGTLTSGVEVNLYRRDDDLHVGTDTTIAGGVFSIPSRFHGERHYLVAKSTVSGLNSAIIDWLLAPTTS